MSVYLVQGRGWRYDFIHKRTRYWDQWFETDKKALRAEIKRREEVEKPIQQIQTPTDMGFLELVNRRLDYLKAYKSDSHYMANLYMAKRWAEKWKDYMCGEITPEHIEQHLLQRRKISANVANKDLRNLRAAFNHGIRKKFISINPTEGLDFFPVEKKIKYVPPTEDIDKVIAVADQDTQDYLWTIRETLARVCEINQLQWSDVNLEARFVILYTRKKEGGHLTPRKIPMTEKLYEVLKQRYEKRDPDKPWVFWHRYWSRKHGRFIEGPYGDRKKLMKGLCKKADVQYFRFHPIRHAGASIMDGNHVPIGAIQRILGHENRKTTEIYLHSIGDLERQAMVAFEQARKKSHKKSHTGIPPTKKGLTGDAVTL